MRAWDFQSSSASPIPMLRPSASRTVLPAAQTSPSALLALVNARRGPSVRTSGSAELTRRRISSPATSPQRAFRSCDYADLGTRGFDMTGLGDPHRKHPSNPQEQKIEHEKDDETDLAAKLAFGDETDGVGGEIACDHEDDVIDDEPHDDFPLMPNARERNPPSRGGKMQSDRTSARDQKCSIFSL